MEYNLYYKKEDLITNYPKPITIKQNEKIIEQAKKCVFRLKVNNSKGTGFFLIIPLDNNKKFYCLVTNHHVFSKENLPNNQEISIILNDNEAKRINLDKNRIIYSTKKYDITIVEIKQKDNITNFLELDERIFNDNSENLYESETIYTLHYPNYADGDFSSISYGILKFIKNADIYHFSSTTEGSSGAPILNISNQKIFGIHKGAIGNNFNSGTFLKQPIIELKKYIKDMENKKNEISLMLEITNEDINKNIYFLDNTDYYSNDDQRYHRHDYLKELDESNTNLYIDNNQCNFKKYFQPKNEGFYFIKLEFKNNIKDCSYMFYECKNIINIDLSHFNSQNIENMGYMFANCSCLQNINFASFKTNKVKNMEYLLSSCKSLSSINLLSFNTENVFNMAGIFNNCSLLETINLSSFNTEKVISMEKMFKNCINLKNIKLNSFNTNNVINMEGMFCNCSKIGYIDLESFNTKQVTNISKMFYNCKKLANLIITKNFEISNAKDITDITFGCINGIKEMFYLK